MEEIQILKDKDIGKVLDAPRIAQISDIPVQTVYTRFRSPYARGRWGVCLYKLPDGTYKKFVHKKNLKLWKKGLNYKGRPFMITTEAKCKECGTKGFIGEDGLCSVCRVKLANN